MCSGLSENYNFLQLSDAAAVIVRVCAEVSVRCEHSEEYVIVVINVVIGCCRCRRE